MAFTPRFRYCIAMLCTGTVFLTVIFSMIGTSPADDSSLIGLHEQVNRMYSPPRIGSNLERHQAHNPHAMVEPVNLTEVYTHHSPVYKGIHIFALGRTGSSFLGQILAQNAKVFYIFEPGRQVDQNIEVKWRTSITKSRVWTSYYIDMLTSLYHCQFKSMDFYLDAVMKLTYHKRISEISNISGHDQCKDQHQQSDTEPADCKPITSQLLHRRCINKKIVVIKTIRIVDIMNLIPLIQDKTIDFKVLHLVRDPRGMLISKLTTWRGYWYVKARMHAEGRTLFGASDMSTKEEKTMDSQCKMWLTTLSFGKSMDGNYMAVRYEDISMNTLLKTREIFESFGLGVVSRNVIDWINKNTKTNKGDAYSITRDSRANAEKWRTQITYDLAKRIQELTSCGQLMDLCGYVKVVQPHDLTNSSLSFIGNTLLL